MNESSRLDPVFGFFWVQKSFPTDSKVIDGDKQSCHFSILSQG